jgi:hypothetical protein
MACFGTTAFAAVLFAPAVTDVAGNNANLHENAGHFGGASAKRKLGRGKLNDSL